MQTLEFLRKILPEEDRGGVYYLAAMDEQGRTAHQPFTNLEAMARAMARRAADPGIAVYHACASYQEAFVMVPDKRRPGEEKKAYRVPANHARARALWVDVDCGADKAATGKGYATKGEAWKAVGGFCNRLGLPLPMVVDSGRGLHCYWPFTHSVKPATWQGMADVLKHQLAKHEVLADPTRTADFSSVLRPVGTWNRKDPADVREVRVIRDAEPVDPNEAIWKVLQAAGGAPTPRRKPVAAAPNDLNSDLTGHLLPPLPSSARLAADRCIMMAVMRDTQGDVGYEHWRGVIGVIKHSEEGYELAEEWSEKREATGHSQLDTAKRFETWDSGPATCEFFARCEGSLCDGCEHRGKIKSPIVLGRVVPEPEATVVQGQPEEQAEVIEYEVPAMPGGYAWDAGLLVRYLKDKDDNWQTFPFCHTLFYPIERIRTEEGRYQLRIRMHPPRGAVREFDIAAGLLPSPAKLLEELADYEITQTNNKDAPMHMTAFMRDWQRELMASVDELRTMTSFGWRDNFTGFLLGDRLYHADGTVRKVLLGGYAKDHHKPGKEHFPPPMGTVAGYAQPLNRVYNRPGMEAMQYAICSAFGSIFTPFGESMYKGLAVTITGEESGKGKTSVCMAALTAFGNAERMTVKSEKGTTANAQWALLGAYNNVPVLLDEFTNVEPAVLSDLVYRISLGEEKLRQTAGKGGVRMAAQCNWAMTPFITANRNLHSLVAQHQANSQAEGVRMIQILVDRYPIPIFEGGESNLVEMALRQMTHNQGAAGDAFLRWAVTHVNDIEAKVQAMMVRVGNEIPGAKFRFYRNHAACTLAAAEVAHALGIIEFDLEALFDWTVQLMRDLCETVRTTNTLGPDDAINQLIADLTPRILVTTQMRTWNDSRGLEKPTRAVNGVLAGRQIIGDAQGREPLAGRLFIVKKEFTLWCHEQRVDPHVVLQHLQQTGVLVGDERVDLSQGSDGYAKSIQPCLIFDTNRLTGAGAQPALRAVA